LHSHTGARIVIVMRTTRPHLPVDEDCAVDLADVCFLVKTAREWPLEEHAHAAARIYDGERPFVWMSPTFTDERDREPLPALSPCGQLVHLPGGRVEMAVVLREQLWSLYLHGELDSPRVARAQGLAA
jgi:hypothetical protein